jgi:hypothetical protein
MAIRGSIVQPCIDVVVDVTKNALNRALSIIKPPVKCVVKVVSKACCVATNLIRGLVWTAIWRHTSLLLFMTFRHDEVWLPFLLSMISVSVMIGVVYLPTYASSSYVPKRQRKWARYRDAMMAKLYERVMKSTVAGRIHEFMYTDCCRRKRSKETALCKAVWKKGVHMSECLSRPTLRVWRGFIHQLDQSEQGAMWFVLQAISSTKVFE